MASTPDPMRPANAAARPAIVIVDVTVVEGAVHRLDALITSNPTHITSIADAVRVRLVVETI